MTLCGLNVEFTVCAVGRQRVGLVCRGHLEECKKVAVSENAALHIEKYDGAEMRCQLPFNPNFEEEKPCWCLEEEEYLKRLRND